MYCTNRHLFLRKGATKWYCTNRCVFVLEKMGCKMVLHNSYNIKAQYLMQLWSNKAVLFTSSLSQNGTSTEETTTSSFMPRILHNTWVAVYKWQCGSTTDTSPSSGPQNLQLWCYGDWVEAISGAVYTWNTQIHPQGRPQHISCSSQSFTQVRKKKGFSTELK